MDQRTLLTIMSVAERLKDTTRHCYTSKGRKESVAEHTWLMTLMAFFMIDEYPNVNMNKVIQMCLIHDLGECFTGDIPTFEKTEAHQEEEELLLLQWVNHLPEPYATNMSALYKEMKEQKTMESKLYKALDGLEAVIQHNLSDISTWEAHEYDLTLTYATNTVNFSNYLKQLRSLIKEDTLAKIQASKLN